MTHNELFSICYEFLYTEPTMLEKRLFHCLAIYDLCSEKWWSKRVGIFNDVANLIRLIGTSYNTINH